MFPRNGMVVPRADTKYDIARYPGITADQTLAFSTGVIAHLLKQRQTKPWHKESGGQLFGRVTPYEIFVVEATGPRSSDVRTRTSYKPDRRAEQVEIDERFQRGLFFLGDWHSHPEKFPSPSGTDSLSMTECFRKSKHSLPWFLLVIIGTGQTWTGAYIALYASGGLKEVIQRP